MGAEDLDQTRIVTCTVHTYIVVILFRLVMGAKDLDQTRIVTFI